MSTSRPTPPLDVPAGPGWCCIGLIWTALIRVPLVLNAHDHLDSDLAVDGLTLLDAVDGHWRWHYPGTPYMGILPMLDFLSSGPGLGGEPDHAGEWRHGHLVTGRRRDILAGGQGLWARGGRLGNLAAGVLVARDDLAVGPDHRRPPADAGVAHGGVRGPLCCLTRGGWPRAAALGLWCGLGLYLDAMFLFTLAGMVPAAFLAWLSTGRSRAGIGLAAVFWLRMLAGLVPREIGRAVDPYDAYPVSVRRDARAQCDSRNTPGCWSSLPAAPDRRDRASIDSKSRSPRSRSGDGLAGSSVASAIGLARPG